MPQHSVRGVAYLGNLLGKAHNQLPLLFPAVMIHRCSNRGGGLVAETREPCFRG